MKNLKSLNKIFWLFVALSTSAVIFNACDDNSEPGGNGGGGNPTPELGVVINGVTWATRNVDAVGTFAPTPESPGKFYQWNRRTAWSATEPGEGIPMPNWDATMPTGTEWTRVNDPSPAGWRVPTLAEIEKLLDTDKVNYQWVRQNNVWGGKFTDIATGNSIFLSATGVRSPNSVLYYAGTNGGYWSSMPTDDNITVYVLGFNNSIAGKTYDSRSCGAPVRSVTE